MFFALQTDKFLTGHNLSLIVQQVVVVGTLAIGQTLIILTAGIDLSNGMIMAFGSVIMTSFAVEFGVPPFLAILLGFLVTTVFGLLNGTLVALVKLPPFIVTLGTLNIAYAITRIYRTTTISNLPPDHAVLGDTFDVGQTAITYGSVVMLVIYLVDVVCAARDGLGTPCVCRGRQPRGHASGRYFHGAPADQRLRRCRLYLRHRRPPPGCAHACRVIHRPDRRPTWIASPRWCWAALACLAGAAISWAH